MNSPMSTINDKPDDSQVPSEAKQAAEDALEEQRFEEEEAEAQRLAEEEELSYDLDEHDQIGAEDNILKF
ncbi:hypothetical protein ACTUVN_002676 [Pseudomonas caspiana]